MRFQRIGSWVNANTGELLLNHLHAASNFQQRLLGLQFAESIPSDAGVLLKDCRSVHTFWMRFPIDIVFLDHSYHIVEVREAVPPWRVAIPKSSSVCHVIESNAGVSSKLELGLLTSIE